MCVVQTDVILSQETGALASRDTCVVLQMRKHLWNVTLGL